MTKIQEGCLSDFVEINPKVKLKKGMAFSFVSMDALEPFYKFVVPKEEKESTSSGSKFCENDVLFARITPCLENGKISVVKGLKDNVGFGSTEFIVLRGKQDILDSDYLYYLCTEQNFRDRAIKLMVGTSGRQRVDIGEFAKINVKIPCLQTQRVISNILASLDEKIELNRRINETLEQMAMELYKHLFVNSNDEDTDYLKLSDIIEINPSIFIKKESIITFVDMKILPVDCMSVQIDDVKKKSFNSGSKFMKDDVLFARITPCLENGKTAFVNFLDDTECGFGSTEFIVLRAKNDCCPQYVYCLSRDEHFRQYAMKSMVGTSGRQRVQTSSISDYPIAKPKSELMREFNETTIDWFIQIRSNMKEISELRKTRDYLLPRLLTGEIEV